MMLFTGHAMAQTTIVVSSIEQGAELSNAPDVFAFAFGTKVSLAAVDLETLSGDAVKINRCLRRRGK